MSNHKPSYPGSPTRGTGNGCAQAVVESNRICTQAVNGSGNAVRKVASFMLVRLLAD